eukprot:scaffold235436_cov35-Tisochrysis_lutea.AAC.1
MQCAARTTAALGSCTAHRPPHTLNLRLCACACRVSRIQSLLQGCREGPFDGEPLLVVRQGVRAHIEAQKALREKGVFSNAIMQVNRVGLPRVFIGALAEDLGKCPSA